MEKNDIQSGGQDPVPKQLFGSLIYSMGHLVHTVTTKRQHTQTQFPKHQGKGRWIIGSIWSGSPLSPLCTVLITLNLQLRKKKWSLKCYMWWPRHEPHCAFIHPLGLAHWIAHNYLCMQRLLLIKCILLCLAESLHNNRVKGSFKKHPGGENSKNKHIK